jgi:hypothetical protein
MLCAFTGGRTVRHSFAILALACVAADPLPEPPKTWEKLDDSKYAHMLLFARDGYAAGIGANIVKGTEHNRAQSFTYTAHRYKQGEKEPTALESRQSTGWLMGDLGPGGALVTGWFANADTLHLPGHKPYSFAQEKVRFAAKGFTADGLLCYVETYLDGKYYYEIALFPIDFKAGKLGESKPLRKWFAQGEDGFSLEFGHGNLFTNGGALVYDGQVPNAARPGFPDRGIEAWDAKTEKLLWREANASAEGIDAGHAYWWNGNAVVRRALVANSKAETFALPKGTQRVELHPPFVMAFVAKEKTDDVAVFDLRTGARREFGLARSRATQQSPSGNHFMRQKAWFLPVPGTDDKMALAQVRMDPATGELRAAYNGALYTVPPTSTDTPKEKPKWVPVP